MEKLRKSVLGYMERVREGRVRLAVSAGFTVLLYLVTLHFMYQGMDKKFVVYTFLCLATGILLGLPRVQNWIWNGLLLAAYLALVPGRIFERMELPLTDMSEIQPGVRFATIMLILLVFAICLLVLQRVRFALAAGNVILALLFTINYYVVLFRGNTIGINDLRAAGTGLSVLKNYTLTIGYEQWYTILYFLFFAVLGAWIDFPWRGRIYHACVTALSVCFLGCSIYFWEYSGYYEAYGFQGYYWDLADNEKLNGFLLSFLVSIRENSMKKPAGYSEQQLREIAEEAEQSYDAQSSPDDGTRPKSPNIIMIMNEAWSDLRVLGELETNQEYMSFINSLDRNTLRGDLYVEILGGLTANTEFEALTGDSLAFLSPTVIPYQAQVNHDIAAMSELLKQQGYQTMAIHPNGPGAWNRQNVYRYFGFEDFITVDDFQVDYDYVGIFLSDECNFHEMIYRYEHRDPQKPFFLFDVTIQNHAGYYDQTPETVCVEEIAGKSELAFDTKEVNCYLSLMKLTDEAFQELVEYFQQVEEPTIICMFGDHQPLLGDGFYNEIFSDGHLTEEQQMTRKYISQYVIWANYDVDWQEYGDVSANYLRSILLECAGVRLSPYDKFLLELRKQYPVITRFTIDEIADAEEVKRYQMLQYHHLMEREYLKELF